MTLVFGLLALGFILLYRHVWNRDFAEQFGGRF
jgi:hypothetical protein